MLPDKRSRSPIPNANAKTRKRYAIFAIIAAVAFGGGSFLKFGLPLLIPAVASANAGMTDDPPQAAIRQPRTNLPNLRARKSNGSCRFTARRNALVCRGCG